MTLGCGDDAENAENTDVTSVPDSNQPPEDVVDTPDTEDPVPDADIPEDTPSEDISVPEDIAVDVQEDTQVPPEPECEVASDCPVPDIETLCEEIACVDETCVFVPVEDGTSCDDGNICSAGGSCQEGVCVGGPEIDCDDNNVCTTDEQCENGACVGIEIECDDEDPCTDDSCDPVEGCIFEPGSGFGCPGNDEDGDGVLDLEDNCPYVYNPEQLDFNDDNEGDACASAACVEGPDIDIIKHNSDLFSQAYTCLPACSSNDADCTPNECMSEALGISEECAGCYLSGALCEVGKCQAECLAGNCDQCKKENCTPSLKVCSGFGLPAVGNQCSPGFQEMCDGSCWPDGYWDGATGNNYCDLELNCANYGNDGGDCSSACPENQTFDCFGNCTPMSALGNGTCDPNFNCLAFGNDEGDCEPLEAETCNSNEFSNCMYLCNDYSALTSSVGNGVCEIAYNCSFMNYDGGDCQEATICPSGQVADCVDGCISINALISEINNGSCNDDLNCSTWTHDGNDCEPITEGGEQGGSGNCAGDQAALQTHGSQLSQTTSQCFQQCGSDTAAVACGTECFADAWGISEECSECFILRGVCIMEQCNSQCQNPQSNACDNCMANFCDDDFQQCAGFSI